MILTASPAARREPGSLAAMVIAVRQFISQNPQYPGNIGFIVTSDEEGPAENGTSKVVDYLKEPQIQPQYCIIGEPSSQESRV